MNNTILQSDPEIVDAVVREVIHRLGLEQNPGMASATDEVSTGETVRLSDKVVTLESLNGRLSENTRIVVQPAAIVTPSVRDELRQRKIELIFQADEPCVGKKSNDALVIARLADHFVATDWLKPLGKIRVICGENFREIGANLAKEANRFRRAVCFAAQPFVAVTALNRHQELRAAFARSKKDVAEIISTLDANLLVLDVTQNRNEQKQLIEFFVGGVA